MVGSYTDSLLKSSPQITEIFPTKSVFPTYRQTKNLKEVLAPSNFRPSSDTSQTVNEGGCFKCDKDRCYLCKNFLLPASKFQSSATGRQYPILSLQSNSRENKFWQLATIQRFLLIQEKFRLAENLRRARCSLDKFDHCWCSQN